MTHDEQWFRALFDDAYGPLMGYALRRVVDRETAQDAVAETFTIAWRRRDAVPDGEMARAYLFGIARRVLANSRRADGRWRRLVEKVSAQRPVEDGPPLADPTLAAALAALGDTDREVLRLAAWDGLSPAEIGVVLGLSPSGASSRLHRARRRLAEELEARGVRTGAMGGGTS